MKLVKYFLQKKSLTILLLLLVLFGGLFAYVKMGKLEDAPFTIKQALVLTPLSGSLSIGSADAGDRRVGGIHTVVGGTLLFEDGESGRAVKNHGLREERDPGG